MDISMKIYFLALYFFVYGFLGWCTEVAFAGFKERHFVNRGFLNGPICPIYGAGVSLVILFLTPLQDHLLLLYIASVLLVTLLDGQWIRSSTINGGIIPICRLTSADMSASYFL